MPLNKIGNEYARAMGNFYATTPKAVFAALAFSLANRCFAKSEGAEIADLLVEEWKTLHENGIVRQRPRKP